MPLQPFSERFSSAFTSKEVVLSERIKTFAQSIGFTQVEVATKISDEGLLEALTNLTKT
jgi:uroporphyrinogen-III synthase